MGEDSLWDRLVRPYLFGEEVTRQIRESLRLRYSLLPYLYTIFASHSAHGSLLMRPMWHEFPHDPRDDDQGGGDLEEGMDGAKEVRGQEDEEDIGAAEQQEYEDYQYANRYVDDDRSDEGFYDRAGYRYDEDWEEGPAEWQGDRLRREGLDGEEDEEEVGRTDYNEEYYHGESEQERDAEDKDEANTGEQFLLGPHLLVQPVTALSATSTNVYLPSPKEGEGVWYDLHTRQRHVSPPHGGVISLPLHPDYIPAFLRGGAILPQRMRSRRSSHASQVDPFTLTVAPDASGAAEGELFLDHYDGYDTAAAVTVRFSYRAGWLTSRFASRGSGHPPPAASSQVEKILILGQSVPLSPTVHIAGRVVMVLSSYDAASRQVMVRRPAVSVGEEWSIELVPGGSD
ncbi:MAG: hypothetical protein SGPRY_013702 [Prymnesium sp.]